MDMNELYNSFLDDPKTEHIAATMASALIKKIRDTPAERIKAVVLDFVNDFDGLFDLLQPMVATVRAIESTSDEEHEEIKFNEINDLTKHSGRYPWGSGENENPDYKEDADGREDPKC